MTTDELRKLMETNPHRGQWCASKEPRGCSVTAWLRCRDKELASFQCDGTMADAECCAAANPDMVLSLLDRIDALETLLKRLHDWDHMDNAGDGAYWRKEIAIALESKKAALRGKEAANGG